MKPKKTVKKTQTVRKYGFMTEPLTYKEASLYLRHFPEPIEGIFSAHLGGTLTVESFTKLINIEKFSGIMAWFCLDDTIPLASKIYLAFEAKGDFIYPEDDTTKVEQLTPGEKDLLISTKPLSESLKSITNYESFLQQDIRLNPSTDKCQSSAHVYGFVKRYLEHPVVGQYQKYGHGYFDNLTGDKDYITKFLSQGGIKYVRYYFGFHSHTVPNFIRIILVPVGSDGKNIVTTLTSATLLQKSVPPPPHQ